MREEFIFLEKLRQSGVTNMYGASPFLAKKFNLTREDANAILVEWMQSYERENYKHIKLTSKDLDEIYAL